MSPLKKISSSDNESLEADDDSADDANLKALKKARFVWQIKGNYHLKNSGCDVETNPGCTEAESSSSVPVEPVSCSSDPSISEPSVEILQSPGLCKHHLQNSQPVAELSPNGNEVSPVESLRKGTTGVSCVVCDTFNENMRRASLSFDEEQPTIPEVLSSNSDWTIEKWQAYQFADAFMDNTINSILDAVGYSPVPESAPDLDLWAAINLPQLDNDSHEEEEEDESVENEGILSAIQRHGLQRLQSLPEESNNLKSAASSSRSSPSPPNSLRTKPLRECTSLYQIGETSCCHKLLPLDSDSDIISKGQISSPFVRKEGETDYPKDSNSADNELSGLQTSYTPTPVFRYNHCSLSVSDVAHVNLCHSSSITHNYPQVGVCNSDEDNRSVSNELKSKSRSDSAQAHKEFSNKLEDQENESCKKREGGGEVFSSSMCKRRCRDVVDDDFKSNSTSDLHSQSSPGLEGSLMSITTHSNDRNSPTFGHFEFMDAAVAAAIQKKGLSALACQDL